jgi:hypothetical protein
MPYPDKDTNRTGSTPAAVLFSLRSLMESRRMQGGGHDPPPKDIRLDEVKDFLGYRRLR